MVKVIPISDFIKFFLGLFLCCYVFVAVLRFFTLCEHYITLLYNFTLKKIHNTPHMYCVFNNHFITKQHPPQEDNMIKCKTTLIALQY